MIPPTRMDTIFWAVSALHVLLLQPRFLCLHCGHLHLVYVIQYTLHTQHNNAIIHHQTIVNTVVQSLFSVRVLGIVNTMTY
jgi:hypothetical protein